MNQQPQFDIKKLKPLIFIIFGVFLLLSIGKFWITIQPGERGVIFRKFSTGLDKGNIYTPGFTIIAPWNEMYVYEVKEQKEEESMDVLDKNGLSIRLDVTVRFHPIYDRIGHLHEEFGATYVSRLVGPEVRSAVRKVMGRYEAEEIYSTKRSEVENAIVEETALVLQANNVTMKTLLIRSITLPDKIRMAIDDKLKQEQEAAAYKYRLEKEESEAKRKIIAAQGEAEANRIVNSSLTPNLLKMRGIEATLKLAESPNAKVVVVGGGKEGLPLILGNN
ncbi:MAG TPA: prohibitin family protein [Flavobacteriales bacterium]|nr:prohibitin family protein [Flavobacteriales bacterium]HIA10553.1 prohibitin family protein [Flavobacteriales bacterium]HIO72957.1 prohibitin family protein [Flavobacteriales bacterium]